MVSHKFPDSFQESLYPYSLRSIFNLGNKNLLENNSLT
jgi:hypothetical protein